MVRVMIKAAVVLAAQKLVNARVEWFERLLVCTFETGRLRRVTSSQDFLGHHKLPFSVGLGRISHAPPLAV